MNPAALLELTKRVRSLFHPLSSPGHGKLSAKLSPLQGKQNFGPTSAAGGPLRGQI